MKNKKRLIMAGILALNLAGNACLAQTPKLDASLNEEVVMVPEGSGLFGVKLETTIYKPAGDGPFPILILNHGKSPGNPAFQSRDRFFVISRLFVHRGYAVVIPMRKGFSKSTGLYVDGGCYLAGNARAQAKDVTATLEYVLQQPWADKDRIIVGGQSHGGLTTMAFGELNFPGVRGLINFAGGLRSDSCQWQSSLVEAFEQFGAQTHVPSIWFYGANDSYFNPDVAQKMYAAYTAAGGQAKLIAFGPFKQDAHMMSGNVDGVKIWWPEVRVFLESLGMPTALLVKPPV